MGQGDGESREFGVSEDGGPAESVSPDPHRGTPPSDAPSAFEIQGPARRIRESAGSLYEDQSDLFIKLSVRFRERWLRQLKGAKLAIFLCLALHIDSENESYPSIDTISAETGYSRPEIIKTIRELEAMELVSVLRTLGQVNRYILATAVAFGERSVHIGGLTKLTGVSRQTSKGPVNFTDDKVNPKKNQKKNLRKNWKNKRRSQKRRHDPNHPFYQDSQ